MNSLRNNSRRLLIVLSLALAAMCPAPSLRAAGDDEKQPKKLVIYPASAPQPALKYQFSPAPLDLKPGNAVVFYGKLKAERNGFYCNRKLQDKLDSYLDAPLEELLDAKEIDQLPELLRYLRRGAVCEQCDWQITIREDGFEALLPEVQESRQYARYLRILARKQIAQGKFDEAAETLKYGFTFGRHVGNGPTLVSGFVGIAMAGIMSDTVEEMIQQPGAPNFYWALTYMPQPFTNMRKNIEGEIIGFDATFPELHNLDEPIADAGYWLIKYWKIFATLNKWSSFIDSKDVTIPSFACVIKDYQVAKNILIQQKMTPAEVEAMPVGRAILMATARTYDEVKDEMLKAYFLPYWQAKPLLDQAEKKLRCMTRQGKVPFPVTLDLLPTGRAGRTAYARIEQRIAFLRVVEALRLYGAAYDGRLPRRLADIKEAPIPVDPVTGEPFFYELRGDAAALRAAPLPGYQLNYEISFGAKTDKNEE